jgi:hypothetical protein
VEVSVISGVDCESPDAAVLVVAGACVVVVVVVAGAIVVVGAAVVVDAVATVVDAETGSASPLPPHAARTSETMISPGDRRTAQFLPDDAWGNLP